MVNQEQLRRLFHYHDGDLFWNVTIINSRAHKGSLAGYRDKTKSNRLLISLRSKRHPVHRLIYLYHHGFIPDCVYHKDGDIKNNRIENLTPHKPVRPSRQAKPLPPDFSTKRRIRKLLEYRSGLLYWKQNMANGQIKAGYAAGYVDEVTGFRLISYNNKIYYSHRLIFLYHHGVKPKRVNFIDGDRANAKIDNLTRHFACRG